MPIFRASAVVRSGCSVATTIGAERRVCLSAAASRRSAVRGTSRARALTDGFTITRLVVATMNSASWAFVLIRFASVAKYASARGPADPQASSSRPRAARGDARAAACETRVIAIARDEPHRRRRDHAHLLDDGREHVRRHLGLLGARGERDGSTVEAGESADDGRLGLLRVERQAVLLRHDHRAQAGQADRCVAVRDVAARHGLEDARERAGVDASRWE